MTSIASSVAVSTCGTRPHRLEASDLSPEVCVQLALESRPGGHPEALSDLQRHPPALHDDHAVRLIEPVPVELLVGAWKECDLYGPGEVFELGVGHDLSLPRDHPAGGAKQTAHADLVAREVCGQLHSLSVRQLRQLR